MRFTKPNTINGVKFAAGDPYAGDTNLGRFLHQRGVIEPDGHPDDAAITAPARKTAWHGAEEGTQDSAPTPEATSRRRAPSKRGKKEQQ